MRNMGNSVSYCEAVAEPEAPAAAAEVVEAAEEVVAVEEEPEPEPEAPQANVKVGTAPLDFRFPSVNQARTCYTHYNEYYKCINEKGDGSDECKYHKKFVNSICPNEWVENWEELRSDGRWFGKY